jgi:hypothetical protein
MKIYLVGNILVDKDSLPIKLKNSLAAVYPDFEFIETDPTENFIPEEGSVVIDTILGLSTIKIFDSLDEFIGHRMISPHDYDLGFHLQLLFKLKKINKIRIIGIPDNQDYDKALIGIIAILKTFS